LKSGFYKFGLSLWLCLIATTQLSAAEIIRGPYLQTSTQTSITIRWRTDAPTNSLVRFGLDCSNMNSSVSSAIVETEHELTLINLVTNTRYFYSVGSSAEILAGDTSYYFTTSPSANTAKPTQIWVLGDAGTQTINQENVRDAYMQNQGATGTDLWIMLGDNAYEDGTDQEYQLSVFDIYPETLRQSPLWTTLGNHDGHTADSQSQSGPYYDIFTLPVNGEAGGVPSGTEAYYSFNYGNIHFVSLDSYDTDNTADSPMMQWLEADLAATTADWIIAFWHHPPYSKGYHDSDDSGAQIRMRENAVRILESYGVDLVLAGHNHTYERSYLIDGHYEDSDTFDTATMLVNGSSGLASTGSAYRKPPMNSNNNGAVYLVTGSAGKVNRNTLGNHPVMYAKIEELGSVVLNIDDDQLNADFVDDAGSILDSFTISKQPEEFILEEFSTQIINYADDAEETVSNSKLNNNSSDLEITIDNKIQLIGLRFTNIPIERNMVITNAWIQFTTDATNTRDSNFIIEGEAGSSPSSYTSANKISARARTTASTAWNPPSWTSIGEANTNQRTPNLAPIISEITNHPGWSAGDAIGLIISGSGKRVAVAHNDGDNTVPGAAQLFIEYASPVIPPASVTAEIDILPDDPTNFVGLAGSSIPLPVAILTTSQTDGDSANFDASLINGASLTFGLGHASPIDPTGIAADIDADGDMDRTFEFDRDDSGIIYGDSHASLQGSTLDGGLFQGTDSITTSKCTRCHP
jgi:hypothetical protein